METRLIVLKLFLDTLEIPVKIDTLSERTGFTPDILTTNLLALELAGLVTTTPGGFYTRRPTGD